MITLVVAASTNNAIGRNGQLLWHLPKDLKFFKNITWGTPVIMGRKTFEAVEKPLPGRINIVITKQPDWKAPNVIVAKDIEQALNKAKETNVKQVSVIGGGEIYRQTISMADRIFMTRVHTNLEGDTFFPEIDPGEWLLTNSIDIDADQKHKYSFSIETWDRRPSAQKK